MNQKEKNKYNLERKLRGTNKRCYQKRKIRDNLSDKGSLEYIKKLSDAQRKRKGPLAGGWIDGRTPENERVKHSIEFRLWREAVFARDNWTCQKYKKRGGIKLHPHHIFNFSQFPRLRFITNNGITFSEKAHKEFHNIYGRKNNNFKQLQEFLCLQ